MKKAYRTMGLIKCLILTKVSNNVQLQLYVSLARIQVEYCTHVWRGLGNDNTIVIEKNAEKSNALYTECPDMSYKLSFTKT